LTSGFRFYIEFQLNHSDRLIKLCWCAFYLTPLKLKLPITNEEIKRIKQEGSYPPGLQLSAIAKLATS
jgi:hypothetical protein